MKKIVGVVLSLCMVFAVTSCGQQGGDYGNVIENYVPVTVENYGRTITIEEMPEKVITAAPNCTEVFCALGLSDMVIGKCCENHSKGSDTEWSDVYSQIPELTFGYPTLEDVLSTDCDFIYAIDWVFEEDFTIEALEKNGITVYVSGAKEYDEVWKEIRDIGKIFNVSDTAEDFIASEQARLDAVEEAIKGKEIKRVFVFDSDTGDGVYTCGASNIESRYIASAGGVNVISNDEKAWFGVPYEEVYNANPEVIIVHDYDWAPYEENVAAMKADPLLSQLDAVKNERFIKLSLDGALPGSRAGKSVETIAEGLFPESFNE